MKLSETEIRHRNAEASGDLVLGVVMNADIEQEAVKGNLEANISLDVPWLVESPSNDATAIVCGAAPSLRDGLDEIASKQRNGAVIYACNAAAQVLVKHGIAPDYQVLLDPSHLAFDCFEVGARVHLLASVVRTELFTMSPAPMLWHPCTEMVMNCVDGMARDFTYIGGGVSVTNYALCIAYALGHRAIDVYGMDSSYESSFYADGTTLDDGQSQQLRVTVEHAGRSFKSTWDMKQQVIVFMKLAHALQTAGVSIGVYGDGLLPHAWKNPQQEPTNANSPSPPAIR